MNEEKRRQWSVGQDMDGFNVIVNRADGGVVCVVIGRWDAQAKEDADLIALAPAMQRTLKNLEAMLEEIERRIDDPWLRVFVEEAEYTVKRVLVKKDD